MNNETKIIQAAQAVKQELHGGVIKVTTDDSIDPWLAEDRSRYNRQLQPLLDAERSRPGGDRSPVVFRLFTGHPETEKLKKQLPEGVRLEDSLGTAHVVDRMKARQVMATIWTKNEATRLFRVSLQVKT